MDAGIGSLRLAIIGYSLPTHDDYVRQVLYRLVRNYQNISIRRVRPDPEARERLLIVDLHRTTSDLKKFKKRYAFVDWEKTILCSAGFGEEALASLGS